MQIEEIENGLRITVPKTDNHTLEELKQKLINDLYTYEKPEDLNDCCCAIDLLKAILENSDTNSYSSTKSNITFGNLKTY